MAQSANATFQGLTAATPWATECIVAIAGWPTLYSVNLATYTLADLTTGGDKLSQFTSLKAIADYPSGAGSSMNGSRPEDGSQSIATLKVVLNDARISGTLHATDLMSRAAYLFGNTGTTHTTTLTADVAIADTTLNVASTTGFASAGNVYIGQECIHYTGTTGTTFTGCTRGYLLTDATKHLSSVKVYDFLPNLYRRSVYVYKGYQTLTSTASFLRAFGGVITDANKDRTRVTISCAANTWETYAQGTRKIVNITDPTSGVVYGDVTHTLSAPAYGGDYQITILNSLTIPTGLGDGHHMLNIEGAWYAIKSLDDERYVPQAGFAPSGSTTQCIVTILKALGGTRGTIDHSGYPPVAGGWTNVDYSQVPPTGDEVPKLILKLLLSVTGDGTNDATYDVFKKGIGLGIPSGKVDQSSFTTVMSAADYDSNQKVFFVFTEPVDAKEFIEKELCKPFGYSLITGNDGKIKLIRHRSPQLFYIAANNNKLKVATTTGATAYTTTLQCGCYTPSEMATEMARAFNALTSGFAVTYSTTTNKFTITNATAFDIDNTGSGWATLGFTSNQTNKTSAAADATAAANTALAQVNGTAAILTENDIKGLAQVPSTDLRISSVTYWANYDWNSDVFRSQKQYIDAESVNLGDTLGTRDFQIKSKGLLIVNGVGHIPIAHLMPPTNGCTGIPWIPTSGYGLDFDSSFAHNLALSLLHRYKQPPLVLKGTLSWKWNTLEIGDALKINYTPTGIVSDPELDAERVYRRVFEVASATPNYRAATVDVTLVGHRYQGAY